MERARLLKLDSRKEWRGRLLCVCVCVFRGVAANSFLVIIETDVCRGAVNLQDLQLIKRH